MDLTPSRWTLQFFCHKPPAHGDTIDPQKPGWVRRLAFLAHAGGRVALDLLYPPSCAVCAASLPPGRSQPAICSPCRGAVVPAQPPGCPHCGAFEIPVDGDKCLCCKDFRLAFDAAVPLGRYDGSLRDHVLAMKRPSGAILANGLAQLWLDLRGESVSTWRPDCIVPVPMFWSRRLRRGVNSPEIVARSLARATGLPMRRDWLRRCRSTLPQAGLKPRARFSNVRDAFAVAKRNPINGLRILLVDDILTTGATCSEAAKALKEAGALWVGVAVLARADGHETA